MNPFAKDTAKNKDLVDAEAAGVIHTMPVNERVEVEGSLADKIIDNPTDFTMALGHAQMAQKSYLEVSKRMFDFLRKTAKTKYLTYGSPGVKVFLQGTREEIEKEETMSAEQYAEYVAKNKK